MRSATEILDGLILAVIVVSASITVGERIILPGYRRIRRLFP
jgi:hypothetical protein